MDTSCSTVYAGLPGCPTGGSALPFMVHAQSKPSVAPAVSTGIVHHACLITSAVTLCGSNILSPTSGHSFGKMDGKWVVFPVCPPNTCFRDVSLATFYTTSRSLGVSNISPVIVPSGSSLVYFTGVFSISSIARTLTAVPLSEEGYGVPTTGTSNIVISSTKVTILIISS